MHMEKWAHWQTESLHGDSPELCRIQTIVVYVKLCCVHAAASSDVVMYVVLVRGRYGKVHSSERFHELTLYLINHRIFLCYEEVT